jgi:hypothetical protein
MPHSHGGNKVVSWPKRAKKETSVRGNMIIETGYRYWGIWGNMGRKKMRTKVISQLRERVGISEQRNGVEH